MATVKVNKMTQCQLFQLLLLFLLFVILERELIPGIPRAQERNTTMGARFLAKQADFVSSKKYFKKCTLLHVLLLIVLREAKKTMAPYKNKMI